MKNIRKRAEVSVFLLSFLSACVAKNTVQSVNIKNDTGDDLYMALAKERVGEGGAMLFYEGKDDVRVIGKDGLVKAGTSVTIKNFPWNPQKEYFHVLWVTKSSADLKAEITAAKKKNYNEFGKYLKLTVLLGHSSGDSIGGGMVAMNSIDLLKVRIFKTNDGAYTSEFIWSDIYSDPLCQDHFFGNLKTNLPM